MSAVAADGDGERVPAAVRDGVADQRMVQHHPECDRQAGERHAHSHKHTHTLQPLSAPL